MYLRSQLRGGDVTEIERTPLRQIIVDSGVASFSSTLGLCLGLYAISWSLQRNRVNNATAWSSELTKQSV